MVAAAAGVYAFYAYEEQAGDRQIALLVSICALIVGVVFGLSGVKEATDEDLRRLEAARDWPVRGRGER
jgi:hypothetical protein